MIEESHQRSANYGVPRTASPDYDPLGRADMALVLEQNRLLHSHAAPVMETLYEQIINTHNMVILTDVTGLIIHTLGDADFLEKADRVALTPGVAWSEQSKGTNAIGTAIAEKVPTSIHADQHYLDANRFLTCSAAPIFDVMGNVVGVLDVTGDQHNFHKHTMALVRMSAQMIENQLFAAAFEESIKLSFHSRPEFLGTLMEGIASFTPGGRFLSASRSGLFQLGLPMSALQTHTFSSLFGMPISALMDHYRTASPGPLQLCLHSGVRVYAKCADLRLPTTSFQHTTSNARSTEAEPAAAPLSSHEQSKARLSSLRYLNTGDEQVAVVIDKLKKVIGRDISILITGETGTGKELLAQAIHNDSPRKAGPFVAVNCASIPETLIESELFGYEDGAFTGARKKGSIGKILQANGGSLFLDEIGDMPLNLQARLLRVLQERMVTPLGSTKSIPVNVALTCATNRNLRDMIARNLFRDDLYYRLNGLVVRLPPLRERTDLDVVIDKLLAAEGNGVRYTVAPAIMAMFRSHGWPGNFRQLTNLMRTAMVMAGDDHEIRIEHLPDDFLDDIATTVPAAGKSVNPTTHDDLATLEDVELSVIQQSLAAHDGNVSATARALGVSRNTIYRKIHP
ncbi:sigma-54-dependent Fis family transcriptional regulator [Actimicrobium sp. CCC2.4]|uniref:sigma-54-dependent Fis family transcriptional regulator n=1 Tax=Actimicrobium sp. CCC2.4 TaxID=3048606 RepID=UPI002AC8D449|nr:sigma-54-dependent Fis family transcriptional regulator [Actimicrobium sp. CCC2.4]MEB0136631.1 sigma-54-dependent Fis family transcriptional regulator [Actimicrobium sp. CCC2.4]WPX34211.1 sigma-54-dependent Fis family transcriptional regulator [Actimicrobium sp. CCC2.4]